MFKKRMLDCILATDNAKHEDLKNETKAILDSIPAGAPIISDDLSEEEKERRKSKVCELVVHASDISYMTRTTGVQKV